MDILNNISHIKIICNNSVKMSQNNPKWNMWLHESVIEEYNEGEFHITVLKIAEDAYNVTKEYKVDSLNHAIILRDLIMTLGSRFHELNNVGTKCYAMEIDDETNVYIFIEMENEVNTKDKWLSCIGFGQKHKLKAKFSVVIPTNDIANKMCLNAMHNDVGSKIEYIHSNTYTDLN